MTIGEKIKMYRKLNKLTQKKLSQLSGVSEISIRKYEAGERNPKPEQLKKIASVLEIGGNELLEIELDSLNIETIGDFMNIFYILKEKIGCDILFNTNPDGSINLSSISIHFKNDKINKYLERIAIEELMSKQRAYELQNYDGDFASTQILIDKFLMDTTKQELTQSTELIIDNK